jgi:hypothetical protein
MENRKATFLEAAYTKTATFLRDIFQYFFCGILFMVLVFLMSELKNYEILTKYEKFSILFNESSLIIWGLVLFIIAFTLGQLFLTLSNPIFSIYKCVHARIPRSLFEKLKNRKRMLGEGLNHIWPKNVEALSKLHEDLPKHLYYEMVVFIDRRDLHNRFIERYNLLLNMRRVLSSIFFVSAIIYIALPKVGTNNPKYYEWFDISEMLIGLILFFISILFYRSTIKTEIGFLNRVITSYIISKEQG